MGEAILTDLLGEKNKIKLKLQALTSTLNFEMH